MYVSLLLIDFVASTAHSHKAENAILRKDKTALPIPVSCARPEEKVNADCGSVLLLAFQANEGLFHVHSKGKLIHQTSEKSTALSLA